MNAEELKNAIQPFYENQAEIGVSVYVILKGADNQEPLRVDIEDTAADGVKELYLNSLRNLITDRDELTVLDLSTADARGDVVYRYDLDELPGEINAIDNILGNDNVPLLNVADENLSNVRALLIEIGNNIGQLVIYKTMMPVNVFKRSSFFLKKSEHRMEKIDDEFLRLSSGFQLLRIGEELLIFDLDAIERSFGFKDIIIKEAEAGVQAIEDLELVENPEVLQELLSDIRYARRFVKVAKNSPVLKNEIPNDRIIDFCRNFPTLSGRIRFNDQEDRISLDTNVSKDLFIKVLMDDFLTSELTELHYMSLSKDSVDNEQTEA
tara:strand:- start:41096 stop:42064 length:969 start_codon:yes stop_codon:yes gene_type:complete